MGASSEMTLRSQDVALTTVDPDQTLKASKALLAFIKKQKETSDKKDLLEDESGSETPIWLTLTTKRFISDTQRLKPHKIAVPHKLANNPEMTICLISASPQRHYKNLVASSEFPEEWRKRITRVIDLTKLSAKYKQFENQRKLFSEHDVFLGDARIISRLPKVLGKTFYKNTAKRPIPVDLESKAKVDGKRVKPAKGGEAVNSCTPAELAAEVEKAVGAALVNLSPSTNTAVRVANASFTAEQIAENAAAVANALVAKLVPQSWKNVRSIYLKGPNTAALPVWLTDELWLEEKDIVADDSEEAKRLLPSQKANVGKKRKSLDGATEEEEGEAAEPVAKKAKKGKKAVAAKAEATEDKLDKEISERKAKLKKQKAAAKKAVDV